MERRLVAIFFVAFNFLGCGPDVVEDFAPSIRKMDIYLQTADGGEETLAISTTFSVSCGTIYNSSGSFVQNLLPVSGASGSIQIIQNAACTLTINSFNDGTSTYSPNSASLVISISAANVITSSGSIASPPVYTNSGSSKVYLFLASSTSSSMTFVYAFDPAVVTAIFVPLVH